jgi:dTDP-4-dehydrorhamnose reductase
MKVLLTGATGQVGRALVAAAPAGIHLEATTRTDLDLADTAAVRAHLLRSQPDLVLNAAAYTAVDPAETDAATASAINADAVVAMAAVLDGTGGKLVHISTDFVFDGAAARAYHPDAARTPLSVYGRTKAEGEDALRRKDLLVRTAWVHAAGGANFVRTMLRLMREREQVHVVADQIGAPTWAAGLARTLWGLIAAGASGKFHHCDAGVATWYDFAVAVQEEALALGLLDRAIPVVPIPTAQYPTPAQRPAFSLLDCTATRSLLQDVHVHWRGNLRRMLQEELALG